MFNQSMGEAVVGIFFYIGVGSVTLLGGVIGVILLGDDMRKLKRNRK